MSTETSRSGSKYKSLGLLSGGLPTAKVGKDRVLDDKTPSSGQVDEPIDNARANNKAPLAGQADGRLDDARRMPSLNANDSAVTQDEGPGGQVGKRGDGVKNQERFQAARSETEASMTISLPFTDYAVRVRLGYNSGG